MCAQQDKPSRLSLLCQGCISAQADLSHRCSPEDDLYPWLHKRAPGEDWSDCPDAQADLSPRWCTCTLIRNAVLRLINWAAQSEKKCLQTCAKYANWDHPAHALIIILCYIFIYSVVSNGSIRWQWRPRSGCTSTQSNLGLHQYTNIILTPPKPHFYIVKMGFTGVYIIFLISAQKHRLWVLVRIASARRF